MAKVCPCTSRATWDSLLPSPWTKTTKNALGMLKEKLSALLPRLPVKNPHPWSLQVVTLRCPMKSTIFVAKPTSLPLIPWIGNMPNRWLRNVSKITATNWDVLAFASILTLSRQTLQFLPTLSSPRLPIPPPRIFPRRPPPTDRPIVLPSDQDSAIFETAVGGAPK